MAAGDAALSAPLYRRLAEQLLARVEAGEWPVGARLPPEIELAASLKVSRATLRNALDELQRRGIVERQRRIGTTVLRQTPDASFVQVLDGVGDILALAERSTFDIDGVDDISDAAAAAAVPMLAGLYSPTGYWLAVRGSRRAPDDLRPFNVSTVLISGQFSGVRPLIGESAGAVYRLIEDSYGLNIARVRQTVSAVALPAAAARRLGCRRGAPALRLDALLYDETGRLVEASTSLFDAQTFQLRSDARRRGATPL